MNVRQLRNNNELFDYLVWLSGELKSKGRPKLSEEVRMASRFASGSASEFLHEAQQTLKKIRDQCAGVLNDAQLADATSVVEQIEVGFQKIGGA